MAAFVIRKVLAVDRRAVAAAIVKVLPFQNAKLHRRRAEHSRLLNLC